VHYQRVNGLTDPIKISAYQSCTLDDLVKHCFIFSRKLGKNWGLQPEKYMVAECERNNPKSVLLEVKDISDIHEDKFIVIF